MVKTSAKDQFVGAVNEVVKMPTKLSQSTNGDAPIGTWMSIGKKTAFKLSQLLKAPAEMLFTPFKETNSKDSFWLKAFSAIETTFASSRNVLLPT